LSRPRPARVTSAGELRRHEQSLPGRRSWPRPETICRAAAGRLLTSPRPAPERLRLPGRPRGAGRHVCDDSNSCTTPDTCQARASVPARRTGNGCGRRPALLQGGRRPWRFTKARRVTPGPVETDPAATVIKLKKNVCTPANRERRPVLDAKHASHELSDFKSSFPAHAPERKRCRWTNPIGPPGTLRVDTLKADLLLVPANKDLKRSSRRRRTTNNTIGVDHYKCYKVRITPRHAQAAEGVQASVLDQFTNPAKLFDLRKPRQPLQPGQQRTGRRSERGRPSPLLPGEEGDGAAEARPPRRRTHERPVRSADPRHHQGDRGLRPVDSRRSTEPPRPRLSRSLSLTRRASPSG